MSVEAAKILLLAVDGAIAAMRAAEQYNKLVQTTLAGGREMTLDDLDAIEAQYKDSRAAFEAAKAAAKAESG